MLELKNICVSFRSERQDKIFGHTRQQVLFDISLSVKKGTCLGILGESGSGKSTMGRVLCGLLRPDSGEALLDGVSVYGSRAGRRNLQNKLSVVFQDYTTSANPRFRVKEIIGEGLTVRERRGKRRLDRARETARLLELVGLPADFAGRFPHELSGGQLQRVCIARAVACSPEVILFDEAISSLDAHTQVQVMEVSTGSGAADAGIQAGDVILAADGQAVSVTSDLLTARRSHIIGDTVTLTILRDGQQFDVEVTLRSNRSFG